MSHGFIARPLALFSFAFAVSAIIFSYLPDFTMHWAIACGVALLISIPPRLRNKRILLFAAAALAGCLWCLLYSAVLSKTGTPSAEAASPEAGILLLPKKISEAIGTSIDRVFPERTAPFIKAITIGDAVALKDDTATYTALAMSGIAHIVAVSGMHVSFLVGMIAPLIKNRRSRAAVAIPLLVLFMAVTGFAPSICRAVIMQSFVIIAPLVRRRSDGVTSVFAALLILLAVNPASITSAGLQLSFLSTLGIILITPKLNKVFSVHADKLPLSKHKAVRAVYRFVGSSLTTTIGALAFSTPLLAYYFGYVSIVSPLTNLLTLWAAAFCFCGGLIAALFGLLAPPIGMAAAAIASIPCDWILWVARWLSRLPYAAVYVSNTYVLVWLVYLYASAAVLIAFRAKLRAVLWTAGSAAVTLCLVLLLTALSPKGTLTLTVLDVGQGQCIVLTDGDATAVIDCGGTQSSAAATAAAAYLQTNAATPVDLLILTHFHEDHAGGVPGLLAREAFRTLVIPEPELGGRTELEDEIIDLATGYGTDIIIVYEPLVFSFGSSEITIYPPFGDKDENEACLTIVVSDGDWDALITGDMPAATELLLLENTDLPDIEIFIAGHHGSKYSSSIDLLEEITPELVIISVSATNTYGHPSEEALGRFKEIGADVLRTDIFGDISVKSR